MKLNPSTTFIGSWRLGYLFFYNVTLYYMKIYVTFYRTVIDEIANHHMLVLPTDSIHQSIVVVEVRSRVLHLLTVLVVYIASYT